MRRTEKLLKLPAVLEKTGLSKTSVYKLVKVGQFPRPVSTISGEKKSNVAWVESEVATWIRSRIAARDAAKAA